MKRREFVKSVIAGGASLLSGPNLFSWQAPTPVGPNTQVKRVLVMFKCHFDAGFIDTQAKVVNRYFTEFFPKAIAVAAQMRESGDHRYVWTTGSWLLYEYLEQASAEDRKRMESAISRGDIAWHALPFSWQTEMMDPSMIEGSLALSKSLDQRFGKKTAGAKMTDVPGHTRGLIAPLAANGVTFLDIGVNGASRPAEVPPIFVWKDSGGATLTMMYHHGYGDVVQVLGSDLAVAVVVRGDNSGPHTSAEIEKTYSELGKRFPNATITASNLSDIATAINPLRDHLPVLTQEIGDTWIYGIASDPLKVARYRELARLRRKWIANGEFHNGDSTDISLLRHLLLEPEHTWGTDTKTWLDYDHYKPKDLAQMLDTKNYKVVEFSWEEKRQDLFDGIKALPPKLRNQATEAMQALSATEPSLTNGKRADAKQEIETDQFILKFDPKTGALHRLRNKATQREWASPDHPLALFSYQALSQTDYARFFDAYIISKADWAPKDFGKPNMQSFGAVSREWLPTLSALYRYEDDRGLRLLAHLEIGDPASQQSGISAFPEKVYLELFLPRSEFSIEIALYWLRKPATRLPEALWLTFNPIVPNDRGWTLDKSGEQVSPFDVVPAGARHMHAVANGFRYHDEKGDFAVDTIDAPLVALGEKSPLNFSRSQPDLSRGVHCCLFNNAWGTNYLMWYGEDMRFRFVMRA